nr:tumor necrosis factor ligand superfamily member 15 isoform X2 [Anolis sagrei ordinatus]
MEVHHRPRAELRQMRCLVALCLFVSLLLSLPVLYLLKRSAGQNLDGEVPTGKMPEAQRLGAHDRNCSNCTSRKKARAHLAACSYVAAKIQSCCTSCCRNDEGTPREPSIQSEEKVPQVGG